MGNERYSMSFSTGGLFRRESVTLATLYLDLGDWNAVRDKTIAENLLQARTQASLKRVCREVFFRLKHLSADELILLTEGNHQEQAYLLWLAVCRHFRFIADFATEVLREHYLSLKPALDYGDFDVFFNRKAEWHEELAAIRPATQSKLRQILFKILREADLLTADRRINPAQLSPKLLWMIQQGKPQELRYFPVFDADLQMTTP